MQAGSTNIRVSNNVKKAAQANISNDKYKKKLSLTPRDVHIGYAGFKICEGWSVSRWAVAHCCTKFLGHLGIKILISVHLVGQ